MQEVWFNDIVSIERETLTVMLSSKVGSKQKRVYTCVWTVSHIVMQEKCKDESQKHNFT